MIEVLTSAQLNTIQDAGRTHALTLGVSIGGAMDGLALAAGNILVGNARNAAGIEVVFYPFRIRFEADTICAVTGADCSAMLDGRAIPPWWAVRVRAGQVLALSAPRSGCRAYVSVAGGLDVPDVLGARATDMKGGFGGLGGHGLQRGNRIAVCPAARAGCALPDDGIGVNPECALLPREGNVTVRFLPAAEYEEFLPRSRERFMTENWTLSSSANRMGYRLEGAELGMRRPLSLFSHGIVPGTIQVPPSGQPIVQMLDANTCGGYPKIGTVIEADLHLLAQLPIQGHVRFEEVRRDTAIAALRRQHAMLDRLEQEVAAFYA
ncbi:allophanate hydrolase [Komagataeibacter nataicola]|uniref:Allophanate hydrolase n=1 Tax=Komagataeibacter nataicola TaxID=265960 RepID=A0A9N7H1V8_9PROT|nr:biotin-dependent carboxyltransferase family protein [Komagataeibacter nataicola]AQU88422.1 allophanate hydrolase [Komagataeibacter nataicola]PYD67119.1 allophanate hydrolase [Komagataeibacter nataicola]WEQ54478.1 biotin-dependent carboxyltransferase family protein [Komagataeibacter nataicola]WNM08857.1 biotin-dependent carboxyltransferase family protein [Komagataeibacter nataicola]GBR17498.1 allophanate hydrolase subunit 2 [Komagataeibacter nataicola NRIC 0616]